MGQVVAQKRGGYHPITTIIRKTNQIFNDMGFRVASGPEIETEYYNFDALNIPAHHPSRDLWDTFWLKPENSGRLLRTHTSPVQIRFMEKNNPPLRVIAPGKVYRYEATDATHEAQFYQVEGLVVGEGITLANLKYTLEHFFSVYFGTNVDVRFRPSYFPFVEPGVEVDMSCFKCNSGDSDCSLCKSTGWIEIMGAGMVHPKVLENSSIDAETFTGFAFGAGIERLAMIKYGIPDVRLFHNGDLRFSKQFE
jgi:phenylalanyl-tRNA synthetase alpha chain